MLRRLKSASRTFLITAFITALLVASGCYSGGRQLAAGTPRVSELRNIQQLQDRFNQDRGTVRLILVISPT